nr:hypothetical protein REQ54_01133 [Rhizobium sp. Q54]
MDRNERKKLPHVASADEAEAFVDTADLAECGLSGLTTVRFGFDRKSAQLNMRLAEALPAAVKRKAKERGYSLGPSDPRSAGTDRTQITQTAIFRSLCRQSEKA